MASTELLDWLAGDFMADWNRNVPKQIDERPTGRPGHPNCWPDSEPSAARTAAATDVESATMRSPLPAS
jgi:hypothetical protein